MTTPQNPKSASSSRGYAASDIVVLSGIEAIRKNPGMYVGSVGDEGAHHLLYELVHNSIDEAMAGECTEIEVVLGAGFAQVTDNGRGIPTEPHPSEGIPACEVAATRLHSGGKFSQRSYGQTAGLHGLGLSCVNALSEKLVLEIFRGGQHYQQQFQRGTRDGAPASKVGATTHGTSITFWPDPQIFTTFRQFDEQVCRERLEELAFLNPGIELRLKNAASGNTLRLKFDTGVAGFLAHLNTREHTLGRDPIEVKTGNAAMSFHAVLQWTTGFEPRIRSYANCVNTVHGGTHVQLLKSGVTRAIQKLMHETGRLNAGSDDAISVDEAIEGFTAVIDLRLNAPKFDSQTKGRLSNIAELASVEAAVFEQVCTALSGNPQLLSMILGKVLEARSAKIAARRVAEKIHFQNIEREFDEAVYKKQFGIRSKNWHDSATWITHDELLGNHAALYEKNDEAIALDVCCGSGVVGASFKGRVKKVFGLDLTPEMVALAGTRLDEVRQGNVYKIPFPDNTFDLVCTREVLHLLPYPERPVAEILRVLKPGGQFIVGQCVPFGEDDGPWMYRIFKKKQPLICNMFQEEDFRKLLLDGGFHKLEMKELNVWESIDRWINSYETTSQHRHEIRALYHNAPVEAKRIHPFKILPNGEIHDLWRWCVYSVRKP